MLNKSSNRNRIARVIGSAPSLRVPVQIDTGKAKAKRAPYPVKGETAIRVIGQ
jgi:hypothetical protein